MLHSINECIRKCHVLCMYTCLVTDSVRDACIMLETYVVFRYSLSCFTLYFLFLCCGMCTLIGLWTLYSQTVQSSSLLCGALAEDCCCHWCTSFSVCTYHRRFSEPHALVVEWVFLVWPQCLWVRVQCGWKQVWIQSGAAILRMVSIREQMYGRVTVTMGAISPSIITLCLIDCCIRQHGIVLSIQGCGGGYLHVILWSAPMADLWSLPSHGVERVCMHACAMQVDQRPAWPIMHACVVHYAYTHLPFTV